MSRGARAVLLVVLLAGSAWADGGIFPRAAVVKPARTPDQRALVRFDGTSETLVVETTLQGEGKDFAWVLPLPAEPQIEASTTGLFPTLEVVCAPRVWTTTEAGWVFLLAPWPLLAYVAIRRGGWRGAVVSWLVICGIVAVVAVTVPSMQAGPSPSPTGVTVISRKGVGAFDTTVVASADAGALRRWLTENGYHVPDAADAIVAEYVRDGWVFVASKLTRDADDAEVRRVHPLAFTFPTREAVYPMRLTGALEESLALELYVLGDSRAEVDGLEVDCCTGSLEDDLDPDTRSDDAPRELRRRGLGARS